MTPEQTRSLASFYARKSKERGGGGFYRVYKGKEFLFTEWAYNKDDMLSFLVVNEIKFDRITPIN